jgi:hypothetical protein
MEADISIWRKTGHFYFALTLGNRQPVKDPRPYVRVRTKLKSA